MSIRALLKKKVVIASTLKPVDDARLYEKIGRTLERSGKYWCHMIGVQGGEVKDLSAHPHNQVRRLSLQRALLPFLILRKVFRIKPDILIVATHELLLAAVLYKALSRKAIVYDVQENYFLNIIHTDAFPPIIRQIIGAWVRLKERTLARFVDLFLLAEKGFEKELPFTSARATVIENKVIIPEGFTHRPTAQGIELLFSGTIDESTGVYEAISTTRLLHNFDNRYTLHIIGYCARPDVLESVRNMISPFPFIKLTGGNALQPHSKIMDAISRAHFGLVFYRPSPHINNRMPTKLYEYMACRLPILIRNDLWWGELVTKAQAGLVIDIQNAVAEELSESLRTTSFYPGGTRNMSYEFDRHTLIDSIDRLVEINIPKGQTTKLTTPA